MSHIDPRAIIDPSARIGENVSIGPWTIIGADVEIGEGSEIASHVVIRGPSKIGKNNRVFQFSTLGEESPDLKYKGEQTTFTMGDNNVIREGVTIHRGTVQDRSDTYIGNNNLLMAYVHVGHDSVIGDNCILVNNASLAGHVHLGDWVILSGYTLVHQYCRIGAHAFTGMSTGITMDVPAYVTVAGTPSKPVSINTEGLKRRGFSKDAIGQLRKAFKLLYRQKLSLEEATEAIAELAKESEEVAVMLESIRVSQRGIMR